jgi:ATP-dependent DNA helicase RecG
VPGQNLKDLDIRRLTNYFRQVRRQDCPMTDDAAAWEQLLLATAIMVEDRGRAVPTVGGMLLFGRRPNHALPQAGITAVAYSGIEKDYASRERASFRGPIVPLLAEDDSILESGLIDVTMDFVRRNSSVAGGIEPDGRRTERWEYPSEAVRETLVNAVAHRDYTVAGIDIELGLYSDRVEALSPGRLPNTVTVEKMRRGYRATRNELIKEVLRDYRYVEATGLGVPRKIVRGMREHNGTEPDLILYDDRFIVRLHSTSVKG